MKLDNEMPGRTYSILHGHAAENFGYVTTRDADTLGVPKQTLWVMHNRGTVERVTRGVFRFPDVPATTLDTYRAATLWPLELEGVLTHATALDLHDLCNINPTKIDVAVPMSFRTTRTPPAVIRLHRLDIPDDELTWQEGLPIVTVPRAIAGAIEQHVGWNLIDQAIDTARARGRITGAQANELRALRPTTAT